MTSALAMSSMRPRGEQAGIAGAGADEVRGHDASTSRAPALSSRCGDLGAQRARAPSPSSSSRTQALPSAAPDERAQP